LQHSYTPQNTILANFYFGKLRVWKVNKIWGYYRFWTWLRTSTLYVCWSVSFH